MTEYGQRRTERYHRIFEEQKKTFPPCFERFEIARKLRRSGEINKAINLFSEVITDCPDFFLAHYNIGLAYESLGMLRKAETHYSAAARLEGKLITRDPSIHNTYGFLLLRLHKFEEAEKEYLKTLELEPGHPKAKRGIEAARKKAVF